MTTLTINYRFTIPDYDSTGWDVAMKNNLVSIDALLGQFNTGISLQGVWVNGTAYVAGISVIDGVTGNIWACGVTNTSIAFPGLFATDRTNNPSWWTNITNPAITAASSANASAASANASAASALAASVSASSAAIAAATSQGYKNVIINGGMNIWQRGTALTNIIGNTYTADMVMAAHNGTGAFVGVGQVAVTDSTVLAAGLNNALVYNVTGAPVSNTYRQLLFRVENPLTLAVKTARLTCWAKADTARTSSLTAATNPGTGGSPSSGVNLGAATFALTTAWQRITTTVIMPAASTIVAGTNNDGWIEAVIGLPINTTLSVQITGIQLEADTGVVTAFEARFPGVELALAQRYYRAGSGIWSSYADVSSTLYAPIFFGVTMRTTPTVSLVLSGGGNYSSPNAAAITTDNFVAVASPISNGYAAFNYTYTADASL
jgi:hypothetical protein